MHDAAVPILFHSNALSGLKVVGLFAVLRDVQTFDLFCFTYAHSGNDIRYFEKDNGADDGEAPGNQYTHKLVAELAPVAVHSADRFACAEDGIDDLLRKDSGQKRADGAARTVNAEGVEGVIVAENRFYLGDHEIADQAGDKPDRQG